MSRHERRLIITRVLLITVAKRILLALVGGLVLYQVYLLVMPGEWFLKYRATVTQGSFAGETVPVELCRERLVGSIKAQGVRTFERSDDVTGKYTTVGQYDFSPDIEAGATCVNVGIKPERLKHTAGYWRFHTDLKFKVGIYEKTTSYDSNVYQVRPQPTAAELMRQLTDQRDSLQMQIDDLERPNASTAQPRSTAPVITMPSTSRTNQPTTSAPPTPSTSSPDAPGQPEQAQEPQGLVPTLLNVVRGLL